MSSSGGRVAKNRQSQSVSMPFDCQKMGSEHSYTLNSLWSIWYCTIAMAFQVYIIANSIKRFTLYLSLPWPNGQPPFTALNAYVVLIGFGVVLLPFFVVVAMMKVGNYSNDGHKLGNPRRAPDSSNNIYQNLQKTAKEVRRRKRFHLFKLIWRHSVPIAPFLHLLAAICFLIPRILMEAQLIRHGFLGKGDIWKTEIDFILNRFEDKKLSILSFLNTITDSERSQLNLETYSLNHYMTKQTSNLVKHYDVAIEESGHLSMELINFGVALFVLAVRYPSVFWKVHKGLGFLFSLQLVVNLVQSLLVYSAFQVAFKVLVCDPRLVLVRFKNSSVQTPLRLTALFISYIILLTLSSTALYMYGLNKYRDWRWAQSRRLHITLGHHRQRLWGYSAHFCAFLSLLVLAVCVCPLVYEYVVIYCGSLDFALFLAIISTATHLLLWISLWLILTIKTKWRFNVSLDGNDYDSKYFADRYDKKSMTGAVRGETPLLVIENGKTYQIRETASKQAIIGMAQNARVNPRPMSPAEDEDIYWLKPKVSTPSKVLNKETPEEDSAITWLQSDKKCGANKNNNKDNDGNSTTGTGTKSKKKCNKKSPKNTPKSTLKSKKNKKEENGIDFDQLSDHSDGDYATLRRIITNDRQFGAGSADPTHLSLCPLRNETIELQNTCIKPTADGDYELLVENPYSRGGHNDIYGDHMLPPQMPNPAYSSNFAHISAPLTVHHFPHTDHLTDQLTPRSGSVSENSSSPEKASDTSSGVHSNSSNEANGTPPPSLLDKRSTSMESVMAQIQAADAATKQPCFRSLSLQRYMSSLPPQQQQMQTNIHTIPQRMSSFNESDQTRVIRRAKTPRRTSDIFNMNSTGTARADVYSRGAHQRMTSFDAPEYMKFHSMPTQPKMVPIPTVPPTATTFGNTDYGTRQTFNDFKPYIANQNLYSHVITGTQKPVVSIAPQVMPINGSPNFLQQSQEQRAATNYSFIPSHCNGNNGPVSAAAHQT